MGEGVKRASVTVVLDGMTAQEAATVAFGGSCAGLEAFATEALLAELASRGADAKLHAARDNAMVTATLAL